MIYTWMYLTLMGELALLGLLVGWACGQNTEHKGQYNKGWQDGGQWTVNYFREHMPTPKPFSEVDLAKELEEYASRPEVIARNKVIFEKSMQIMADYLDNNGACDRLINEVDADWEDKHGEDK